MNWFTRFQFSTPRTLGFLPRIRREGGGQLPTGFEPVQTFPSRRSFPRAFNMLRVNCAQPRFISASSAIPEFTPNSRSPGVLLTSIAMEIMLLSLARDDGLLRSKGAPHLQSPSLTLIEANFPIFSDAASHAVLLAKDQGSGVLVSFAVCPLQRFS
jgi:hypothetical protein